MGVQKFFTDEYTSVLQKSVRQIVADPSTYKGQELMPTIQLAANKVRVEVIEATGGLTSEHKPGSDVKYIDSFSSYVTEFTPPKFKEAIHMDEEKILFLRELGSNDPSMRGVRKYINQHVERLKRRIESRQEKMRWDALINGGYSWQGGAVSFGIPAQNRAVPVGALWSLNGISANPLANPIDDIRFWTLGGYAPFRKYNIKKMWMNKNTARWILENANTKAYVTSYGANVNVNKYDTAAVLSFLIPGAPELVIYDGWYQTESKDPGSGKIVTSDAIYMLADGYIYFDAMLPDGDKIGEVQETVHLAEGTIDNPGYGRFLVIEDNTAPGTKGGPSNPYIDIVGGFYGGAKLDRPFDALSAKVIA